MTVSSEDVEAVRRAEFPDTIDITDRIEVYEKGKVFACDCGQDYGVVHDEHFIKCVSCNKILEDRDYDKREEQAEYRMKHGDLAARNGNDGPEQSTLGDW